MRLAGLIAPGIDVGRIPPAAWSAGDFAPPPPGQLFIIQQSLFKVVGNVQARLDEKVGTPAGPPDGDGFILTAQNDRTESRRVGPMLKARQTKAYGRLEAGWSQIEPRYRAWLVKTRPEKHRPPPSDDVTAAPEPDEPQPSYLTKLRQFREVAQRQIADRRARGMDVAPLVARLSKIDEEIARVRRDEAADRDDDDLSDLEDEKKDDYPLIAGRPYVRWIWCGCLGWLLRYVTAADKKYQALRPMVWQDAGERAVAEALNRFGGLRCGADPATVNVRRAPENPRPMTLRQAEQILAAAAGRPVPAMSAAPTMWQQQLRPLAAHVQFVLAHMPEGDRRKPWFAYLRLLAARAAHGRPIYFTDKDLREAPALAGIKLSAEDVRHIQWILENTQPPGWDDGVERFLKDRPKLADGSLGAYSRRRR